MQVPVPSTPLIPDGGLELKAKLFRGLADRSRLTILEALRSGERTVTEICSATGRSQPNVSGHLACLKDCGLVTSRPAGRFVYYSLADVRIEDLLHCAESILAAVAARVYACTRYDEARDAR